jgi:hypothetical protein
MEESMTEERSCGTCGHYVSDRCVRPGGCCFHHSKWQPIAQEKPMENKVIFESEEQFVNFWKDLTGCDCLPGTREKIKQKGYIRKSAVEEAEEEYLNYNSGNNCYVAEIVLDKMHLAIQELKSEIVRLKK